MKQQTIETGLCAIGCLVIPSACAMQDYSVDVSHLYSILSHEG